MSPGTLHIHLHTQTLQLISGESVLFSSPVSSGKAGTGSESGSGKTPTGRFSICAKIGAGEPQNTIFRSRLPAGSYPQRIPADMDEQSDFILTRILWLDGLEPGNANTRQRYIYIHGTNRTDLLGTPASCGCIRLSPHDMLTLFDMVEEDTAVIIRP